MEIEPEKHGFGARLADALAGPTVRAAALGGAGGLGIVALAFTTLALRPAIALVPDATSIPPVRLAAAGITKTDRLARTETSTSDTATPDTVTDTATALPADAAERLAAVASGSAMVAPADPAAEAYAPVETRGEAVAAIDGMLTRPPQIVVASLDPSTIAAVGPTGLGDQAVIAEEDDDTDVVPMPRDRPAHVPEPEILPVPRPRPALSLASLAPGISEGTGIANRGGIAQNATIDIVKPQQRRNGQALAFFSNPTEPVRPPSVTVDTPFGVPYVLQTDSVETACLKPELVDILRRFEAHYHQKVVITSGYRDRGRQGSLHRQCAAADIQVPGVTAAALASFARSLPSIGGVGTYCHPSMIHVDIGTPRDWKYGCGSFFAMRGTPGKWGKVPSALGRAQTAAYAEQD